MSHRFLIYCWHNVDSTAAFPTAPGAGSRGFDAQILRRYDAPATFYLVPDFLDRVRPPWWERLDVLGHQVGDSRLIGGCPMKLRSHTFVTDLTLVQQVTTRAHKLVVVSGHYQ